MTAPAAHETAVPAAGRCGPTPDADSQFFWSGLREHKIALQHCTACGRHRFPPMPTCPYCAAPESDRDTASGLGTVYSWIVVHRAFDPTFAGDVPYTLATVDLDEGARLVGRIEGGAPIGFGQRVSAMYVDHSDWTELRFVAATAGR